MSEGGEAINGNASTRGRRAGGGQWGGAEAGKYAFRATLTETRQGRKLGVGRGCLAEEDYEDSACEYGGVPSVNGACSGGRLEENENVKEALFEPEVGARKSAAEGTSCAKTPTTVTVAVVAPAASPPPDDLLVIAAVAASAGRGKGIVARAVSRVEESVFLSTGAGKMVAPVVATFVDDDEDADRKQETNQQEAASIFCAELEVSRREGFGERVRPNFFSG